MIAAESGFPFPPSRRLRRASEYLAVRERGTSRTGRGFRLARLDHPAAERSRLGLITPRRIGTAVQRNRIRRRFREIFRHHQHKLRPGLWLVVIARREACDMKFLELREEFLRLGRKLSIFEEPQ